MCEEYKNAGRFCQPKENKIYETEPLHFSVQIWLWACCWCSITKSVWLFVTPWNAACPATLSCTISWSLLKFTPIVLVMLSNQFILFCLPHLLSSILPSIRVFSKELLLCIKWPKYWSFSFSIIASMNTEELISFRIDWFDLLAVHRTLKSLLWHDNSKNQFFSAQPF